LAPPKDFFKTPEDNLMLKRVIIAGATLALLSANALAQSPGQAHQQCSIPASVVSNVQAQLAKVITQNNGGLFQPNNMWSAVVDRQGVLCSVINTIGQPDGSGPGQDPWPGSRSIAIAKATTANGFSNDKLAISTANLYGVTQPGGSLWGLNETNPFNPQFQPQGTGIGYVPGGIVTFGGGVALYQGGKVIGGLGVSGDTSCADHAIAFRMRAAALLQPKVGGPGLNGTDNILYNPDTSCLPGGPGSTKPSSTACAAATSNTFMHPHCKPSGDVTP
jgi:uncharacterized protein GlcG (DUF336 family)